ncbi:hypothetical protein B7760_03682 [Burkholderia glumae]|nr:hypothetical protein [Burkholderia glumae]QKM49624.1 hypothetical protein B7760_03682 [Burkholderia glumae]
MSWFIYEVPEYHEDGARIEPFSDLRDRVLKLSGQSMVDELESIRENAVTTAATPRTRCSAWRTRRCFRFPTPIR